MTHNCRHHDFIASSKFFGVRHLVKAAGSTASQTTSASKTLGFVTAGTDNQGRARHHHTHTYKPYAAPKWPRTATSDQPAATSNSFSHQAITRSASGRSWPYSRRHDGMVCHISLSRTPHSSLPAAPPIQASVPRILPSLTLMSPS